MKELEIFVDDLNKYLATKELELKKDKNFNSYTEGLLLNRQAEIESFENACKNCDTNPFLKTNIIENFKNDSIKIKSKIDEISNK